MKTNPQKQYDSPRIKVLEVKFEGIICESPLTSGGMPGGSENEEI